MSVGMATKRHHEKGQAANTLAETQNHQIEPLQTRSARRESRAQEGNLDAVWRLRRQRVRLLPIWLRLVIVGLLTSICLLAGLVIGYGVVGNSENAWEVLSPQLWYSMIDAIRGH
ncbi:DNA-directed RNA polymerase subunit beta [Shouchella lonarensis]|uniref:DNA-directed RNA polymerase subunit beta n=2 Tax=Shouchella lonarensis TaxID=1464122 RepID=A0A1G6GXV9_9BACI|nr:DNA-directed RNA polymerase subunit beta [Shouchella lonarensis]